MKTQTAKLYRTKKNAPGRIVQPFSRLRLLGKMYIHTISLTRNCQPQSERLSAFSLARFLPVFNIVFVWFTFVRQL